jgi:copper(I)-binding protein
MQKFLLILAFFFYVPDFAAAQYLIVQNGWAHPTPANAEKMTVWFTVVNPTKTGDTITEIVTPLANTVKICRLSQRRDGVRRRDKVRDLEILPFSVLQLDSAGYEVVLYNPKKSLKAGDMFPLFFTFAKAGEKKLLIEIKEK